MSTKTKNEQAPATKEPSAKKQSAKTPVGTTTKDETPTPKESEAKPKADRKNASDSDKFYFVNRPTEGEGDEQKPVKIAPQAAGIVSTVEAAGKDGITRKELVELLDTVIETRQPVSRILTYYQKMLVEKGFLRVDKAEAAE